MQFPWIETIDDVLPAIKGHDEFKVCERPFGTVVNYMVQLPDSFDDPIRRECRGIIFYPDGKIMSRPFHKFFNLGERNETRPANLDFNANPVIMDKLDGSMIRPVFPCQYVDGDDTPRYLSFYLGTKMGITDVGNQAQAWLDADLERKKLYTSFIRRCRSLNITPLFEWCSRQQRIVVDYPEDQLVLTALRYNESGKYVENIDCPMTVGLPLVKKWDHHNIDQLQQLSAERQDIEGWVVAWPNGLRVKAKVDWYVTLHKVKECIAREKYVIDAILNDYLDDLKGKLQEQDLKAVQDFEGPFTAGMWRLIEQVGNEWNALQITIAEDRRVLSIYMEGDDALDRAVKKAYAGYVKDKPSWMRPILFSLYDRKIEHPSEGVINMLKSSTATQTQIDANRHLWGGARYQYGGVNIDE